MLQTGTARGNVFYIYRVAQETARPCRPTKAAGVARILVRHLFFRELKPLCKPP